MKNRIGIVGGGQLGRMLGMAAKQMGFTVTVMDATPQSPAGQVVDLQLEGTYSDPEVTEKLAGISDYLTVEIEHINTETLKKLVKQGIKVNPAPETIELIKNKFAQKEYLSKNKIPTAPFREIENCHSSLRDHKMAKQSSKEQSRLLSRSFPLGPRNDITKELERIANTFGYPFVLKKKFDAFDGRGNALIRKKSDIAKAFEKLGKQNLYAEKFVPFIKELAVIIVRDMQGKVAIYPVVQTIHKNNICHIVMAPAPINRKLQQKAQSLALKVMKHLQGAGVFAVEMFLTEKGDILVNEIAPRVHNSGHFTIEACYTSQFEQHIRAISGLPLGSTQMKVPAAVMINILGERKGTAEVKNLAKVLQMPNVSVHIYGKAETKPERKMGHITVVGDSIEECFKKAKKARRLIDI